MSVSHTPGFPHHGPYCQPHWPLERTGEMAECRDSQPPTQGHQQPTGPEPAATRWPQKRSDGAKPDTELQSQSYKLPLKSYKHLSMQSWSFAKLLGDLIEKGVAWKFYYLSWEFQVRLETLVDTGADITLMSNQLFKEVEEHIKRTSRTLHLQKCAMNIQAYSQTGLRLERVAPIYLTVGPKSLVHPVQRCE